MSIPKGIVDDQRKPVSLLKLLGRGGEGAVYEVLGDPTKAAKIYFPDKAGSRRDKVLAMVRARLQDGVASVAFPTKPLYHSNGEFAGFTMEKVKGRSPVHELYSPSSRRTKFTKATFPFLVRSAANVAHAVAAVHAKGCVIGDINHSGILISEDARTTLIDADSFQFGQNNDLFRCIVATEDFTPPELQGRRPDEVVRTANHDSFGLGVIIFMLLFMGRHPFIGDYLGTGSLPFEKAIKEYRFAFSAERNRTGMEPPPHLPTMPDLPPALAKAFETTFGPTVSAGGRPTAIEWFHLLKQAEAELTPCQHSPAHHYFRSAKACPWCRMERGFPGFVAFATTVRVSGSDPVDLTQLISAIRAVPDPGIGAPLLSAMPVVHVVAKPTIPANEAISPFTGATLGALVAIPLFTTQAINPLLALCGYVGCAYAALRAPTASQPKQRASEVLQRGYELHEQRYLALTDNRRFINARQETEKDIRELGGLGNEEARQVAALSQRLREMQLHRFLDKFQIAPAKIKGLGSTRKATLRSYGIETAADVDKARIEAISGFGPATSSLLLSWRSSLERRFVFNPSQPVNPADVAQIKTSIAQKRARLEQALRAKLVELQTISTETIHSRRTIVGHATNVWKDLKQAEADEEALPALANISKRRWLFVALSAGTFILSTSLSSTISLSPAPQNSTSTTAAVNPTAQVTKSAPTNFLSKSPGATVKPVTAPSLPAPPISGAKIDTSKSIEGPAAPSSIGIESTQPDRRTLTAAPPGLFQGPTTSMGTTAPQAVWPPIIATSPDDGRATSPSSPLSLSPVDHTASLSPSSNEARTEAAPSRSDTSFVNGRLNELGYLELTRNIDSFEVKRAIRDLKVVNGLPGNDTLDEATIKLLNSHSPLPMKQSFLGGWSTEEACSDGARLEISTNEAKAEAGSCKFSRVTLGENTWKVRAKCQVGAQAWPANIIFRVQGRRLEWSSEKGRQYYYRCR